MTAGYGRAYASAIPGATFELVHEAGHLPRLGCDLRSRSRCLHDLLADTVLVEVVWCSSVAVSTAAAVTSSGEGAQRVEGIALGKEATFAAARRQSIGRVRVSLVSRLVHC